MFSRPLTRSISAGAAIGVFLLSFPASACTRFVYQGGAGQVVTGRTMDWKEDIGTNLWVFPKGMARTGETGANSITWTSKYGSVIASGYDIATTDGLNEVGLVANVLWLVESEYPEYDGKSPGLAISAWAQFVLDNYGTVAEAVEGLRAEPFTIVAAKVPGSEMLATVHLSLSDKSGDSAIVEYIGGKQVIHHSRDYQVMTNSPVFEQQLALNAYWKEIGGTVMLPGTNRAADRFARASFYVNAIPKTDDPVETIASAFSVIRNVSVPFGIDAGSAQHFLHAVADSHRSQARAIFLRERARAERVLGGSGEIRSGGSDGQGDEARPRAGANDDLFGYGERAVQGGKAVQISGIGEVVPASPTTLETRMATGGDKEGRQSVQAVYCKPDLKFDWRCSRDCRREGKLPAKAMIDS